MVSLEQRYKAASRCVFVWPQVTPDLEKKMAARSSYYVCRGGNRTHYFVLLCIHERHNEPVNTLVSQHPYFIHWSLQNSFPFLFQSPLAAVALLCALGGPTSPWRLTNRKPAVVLCACLGPNVLQENAFRPPSKFSRYFFSLRHTKIRTQKASCRISLIRRKPANQLSWVLLGFLTRRCCLPHSQCVID